MTGNTILGVDPSFNRTGWALMTSDDDDGLQLLAWGVVKPRGKDRGESLLSIHRQFRDVVVEQRPGGAYLERPGTWQRRGGSRRETVEAMAMARGVMLAACAEFSVTAIEIEAYRVRLLLLGRTNAKASSVVTFVRDQGIDLPRRPRGAVDLDVANAVLMAAYGFETND